MGTKETTPITEQVHTRAPYWQDVPDEKWMDWRWQMSNRLNDVEELDAVIRLTDSEKKALGSSGLFRVDITPYFASLIDPDDPHDPVRKQVIPTAREMVPFQSMMEDSLAEDKHSPVPGLVHRYPDRVLMLITTQCASYCRYCTRARMVGSAGERSVKKSDIEAALEYIEQTPVVRDVLISGGDPLSLDDERLEYILRRLRRIKHVEFIRIGSKQPVVQPMRITPLLTRILKRYHPLWMSLHFTHESEITPEVTEACGRLADAERVVAAAAVTERLVLDSAATLVQLRVRQFVHMERVGDLNGVGQHPIEHRPVRAGQIERAVAARLRDRHGLRGQRAGGQRRCRGQTYREKSPRHAVRDRANSGASTTTYRPHRMPSTA